MNHLMRYCLIFLFVIMSLIQTGLAEEIKPNFEIQKRIAIGVGKLDGVRPDGDGGRGVCQFSCPTGGYTISVVENAGGASGYLRLTTGPITEFGKSARAISLFGTLHPFPINGSVELVSTNAKLSDNYCSKNGPLTGTVYRITQRQDSHMAETRPLAGPMSDYCLDSLNLPSQFNSYSANGTTVGTCVPHNCGGQSDGYDAVDDYNQESYEKWWKRLHFDWKLEANYFEELNSGDDREDGFILNGLVGISENITLPKF